MDGRSRPHVPDLRADIARRTIKDMIGDKLIALITSGILQVGDELPSERELAAMLLVSRESVRGAVQALAARGVVEVSHGARTRVRKAHVLPEGETIVGAAAINRYDLAAVHGARLLIELAVVADAAEAIDADTLSVLERSLAKQADYMDDPLRFLICDKEFHVAVYRAAPNPLLADIVTSLYTYMLEHRRVAMAQPGAIARSYEDHQAIFRGLRDRSREAVVEAFRRHIIRIYETTVPLLGDRPAA